MKPILLLFLLCIIGCKPERPTTFEAIVIQPWQDLDPIIRVYFTDDTTNFRQQCNVFYPGSLITIKKISL